MDKIIKALSHILTEEEIMREPTNEEKHQDCWKCSSRDLCPKFNGDCDITWGECRYLRKTNEPLPTRGVVWH
jgi:hypothetical protein